ncbi:HEXXH motif domain-containing protein [Dactylosporangium sp. McL0621]|uniref:HEXXH motif domain-containing protein n=1 Tax=Dactylosporangium sp. McL0621 TaxID=3415678 RepID=UPI003CE892C0
MTTQRLRLRPEQFAGIAAGYGDAGAMAVLAAGQLAKRKALIAMVLRAARGSRHETPISGAAELITRAEEAAEPAVAGVLALPHLDAWATLCLQRLADGDDGDDLAGLLGHLNAYAAAAAIAAGLSFGLTVPTVDGAAGIPGLGSATGLGPGPARVVGTASSVLITGAGGTEVALDGPGWRPRRTVVLDGGWHLAIEDLDPYRHCYDWRPLPYLTEARARHLEKLLTDAWRLIRRDHPGHAEGLRHSLRAIVPLATPEGGTLISAASRHTAGAIAASIPDDAADLALLLIHEYMHAKLGALLDLVDLVDRPGPDAAPGFHAPWRLDPRPAPALLQGVYAHAGVTDFWRRRRHDPGADQRRAAAQFAYWRAMNRTAIAALLGSGQLTPAGDRFARALSATLDGWQDEPVASGIAARTRWYMTAQTTRWLLLNAHASTGEIERLTALMDHGTAAGPIAEHGEIRAGTARGPVDAPGLLGDLRRWLDPDAPPTAEPHPAGPLLLSGDAAGAEHYCLTSLDADPADDESWIGLAVARTVAGRADPATRLLRRRPELLRAATLTFFDAGHSAPVTDLLRRLATEPTATG